MMIISLLIQKTLIKLSSIKVRKLTGNLYNYPFEYQILLWILILAFSYQLFYFLFFYLRFLQSQPPLKQSVSIPVSVIICAKNEAENLRKYLPGILEQEYPHYEVIVVDDCSEDDTEEVLATLKQRYKHLRSTSITKDEKFTHGKKLALTLGIKAASYEWLLLTDADCEVKSPVWLKHMSGNFTKETEVVLGYGPYQTKKGWLNKLIRLDTVYIALHYFSYALAGIPYMGVGRNLAYKKSLFFKNKGFVSHSNLTSGDDDLFINEVSHQNNTRIEIAPESFTYSNPSKNFREWTRQKRRHLSTGHRYRRKHKLLLASEPFTRYLFFILSIILLCQSVFFEIVLSLLVIRYIILYILLYFIYKRLNEKYLLLYSLFYDLLFPVLIIVLNFMNYYLKKNTWK